MTDLNNVDEKLVEIFRIVLDVESDFDIRSVRRLNETRWDSLAHVSLIVAIESEFGLQLEIAEMERMTSFAATRILLEEKGV